VQQQANYVVLLQAYDAVLLQAYLAEGRIRGRWRWEPLGLQRLKVSFFDYSPTHTKGALAGAFAVSSDSAVNR